MMNRRLNRGRDWQPHTKRAAGRIACLDVEVPAVSGRDPSRNRQAESGAVAAARGIDTHEAIEDALAIRFGNAGALIFHADGDA